MDDLAYFEKQLEVGLGLHIVRRNSLWHVYETSTEPWGLVTAFESEGEAIRFRDSNGKYIRTTRSPWTKTTLQEDTYRCCICNRGLSAGYEVALSTVTSHFYTKEGSVVTKTIHEARCLHHIPTRFERDEPV